MPYFCNLCDKTISLKRKHEHLKSKKKHKFLEDFIIIRYFVENPDITQVNEIMGKYADIHNKKYGLYQVPCLLKVNDNQNITCQPMLNLDYKTYPDINIENQPSFSQVLEMRITFISSQIHMKFDYYLKQPMPTCEFKLNQLLHKKPTTYILS